MRIEPPTHPSLFSNSSTPPSEEFLQLSEELSQNMQTMGNLLTQVSQNPSLANEPQFQALICQASFNVHGTIATINNPRDKDLSPTERSSLQANFANFETNVMTAQIPGAPCNLDDITWTGTPLPTVQSFLQSLLKANLASSMGSSAAGDAKTIWNNAAQYLPSPSEGGDLAKQFSSLIQDLTSLLQQVQADPSKAIDQNIQKSIANDVTELASFWKDHASELDSTESDLLSALSTPMQSMVLFSGTPNNTSVLFDAAQDVQAGNYSSMTVLLQTWTQNPGTLTDILLPTLEQTASLYEGYPS